MPTGIEEVGFVLAVWPILFQLLDQYSDGIDLIKKWIRYKKTAKSLQRMLKAEAFIFRNASCNFLEVVLGPESRKLWNSSESDAWKDPQVAKAVKQRLGEETWGIFEGVMFEISEILAKLLQGLHRNLNIDRSSPLYGALASLSARYRVVFRNRDVSLEHLHRDIDIFQNMIRNLPAQNLSAHNLPTQRINTLQVSATPNVVPLRRKASDLSEAIEKSLHCSCSVCHVAILRLDNSFSMPLFAEETRKPQSDEAAFHLDFQTSREWKSIAATIREEHAANCNTARIDNLCQRLVDGSNDQRPLGCLGHSIGQTCICIGSRPAVQGRSEVSTLHQILSSDKRHTRFPFDTRDRLKLGLILANSLLGLHSTPWLNDMWTSRDILFRPLAGDLDEEAVFQPYVMRAFREPDQPLSGPSPPSHVRNAALYALGKVLIQLVENKPLLKDSGKDGKALLGNEDPEMDAAFKLEETIARKAGSTWEQVIRRCLRCDFDIATSKASLSNDDFLRKVYAGVILPLSEALKVVESL